MAWTASPVLLLCNAMTAREGRANEIFEEAQNFDIVIRAGTQRHHRGDHSEQRRIYDTRCIDA
eukprot:248470-Pyramimonas_sp.AAC.1